MKTCTKCGEEKPLDEFGVDRKRRDGKFPQCKPCKNSSRSKEAIAAANKRRRSQPGAREAEIAYLREWRAKNNDRCREYVRKKEATQKGKAQKQMRVRKRQAAKLQRTPSWANDQLIAAYYLEAKRLEELTGIQFHVDHIIPLQGELVSGLHVETNLQLLPAHENQGKSNRFDPETFVS